MSKSKHQPQPSSNVISFRPGPAMETWLETAAKQWGLKSPAEAAKHAAILTLCGFDAAFYEPIMGFIRTRKMEHAPDAFADTAFDIRRLVSMDNEARAAMKKGPLSRAEIIERINEATARAAQAMTTMTATPAHEPSPQLEMAK
jgi:hypothetical protein